MKIFFTLCLLFAVRAVHAAELVIADGGKTSSIILVAPEAKTDRARSAEYDAALDLQNTIEKMTGARPALADTLETIEAALKTTSPLFVVGEAALKIEPTLNLKLSKVAKPNPTLRADAIILRRAANRIYLAGTNAQSHGYAVTQLLQNWGCRWYLPGALGECIPKTARLAIDELEFAYAPPFEIRRAWNRNSEDGPSFERRTWQASTMVSPAMNSLAQYTKELVPAGKDMYAIPFSGETAARVAEKIEAKYAAGVSEIPLAAFIGDYRGDTARETELRANIFSKYTGQFFSTDAMMEFLNGVARILRQKHPDSKTKIIGIAYSSVLLPPQRAFTPEPALVMWLVPVDFDPIHAMDDASSPQKQEWRAIMERWSSLMQGRVAIYDYLETMLVWRDLPINSIHVFSRDARIYRDAKILGFNPEPRGSLAVNFLNVYFRAQLMWNPDADVAAMLAEFYAKFYGPAAAPMREYHQAIFAAWNNTLATEHEYFLAPSIYTPEVVEKMRGAMKQAQAIEAKIDRTQSEGIYAQRIEMARIGFEILDGYMAMSRAGAREGNYVEAVAAGKRGLAAQLRLAKFAPILSPNINAKRDEIPLGGDPSSWAGEAAQFQEYADLTDGTKGTLVAKLPLEWAFRRDPHDSGLARGWAFVPVDLAFWNANKSRFQGEARKDFPTTQWEMVSTDLYLQAQGIRHPDGQSYTGFGWYRADVDLQKEQTAGTVRMVFPGLFNECWLYINGNLVAHRPQNPIWAWNSYRFDWDVDVSSHLRAGQNMVALRINNVQSFGGMFRRPFIARVN